MKKKKLKSKTDKKDATIIYFVLLVFLWPVIHVIILDMFFDNLDFSILILSLVSTWFICYRILADLLDELSHNRSFFLVSISLLYIFTSVSYTICSKCERLNDHGIWIVIICLNILMNFLLIVNNNEIRTTGGCNNEKKKIK